MNKALALLSMMLASLASLDAPAAGESNLSGDGIVQYALRLRQAIVDRDRKFLTAASREIGGFQDNNADFAFTDQYVQRYLGETKKSLRTILSSQNVKVIYEGPINVREENDLVFIIYFYEDDSKIREQRVPNVVTTTWMSDYAACKVVFRNSGIFLKDSFCFDETQGPW